MPFDANLVLRGEYGGTLVDLDESDAVCTALTMNDDGNIVVDLKKTGKKGLAAVVICTEAADSAAYTDRATLSIEESDELDRNWQTAVTFPVLINFLRTIHVTATTGFVVGDIGQLITEETSTDTGLLISFDEALKTASGIGELLVEMVDSGDVFGADLAKTETSSGTGRSTKRLVTTVPDQMMPGIYVRRFTTNKRYLRFNGETVADSIGKVWVLIGDDVLDTL